MVENTFPASFHGSNPRVQNNQSICVFQSRRGHPFRRQLLTHLPLWRMFQWQLRSAILRSPSGWEETCSCISCLNMFHSEKKNKLNFQQRICTKTVAVIGKQGGTDHFLDGSFHGLHCQNQRLKMMTKNYCCIKISCDRDMLRKTMHSLHKT